MLVYASLQKLLRQSKLVDLSFLFSFQKLTQTANILQEQVNMSNLQLAQTRHEVQQQHNETSWRFQDLRVNLTSVSFATLAHLQ